MTAPMTGSATASLAGHMIASSPPPSPAPSRLARSSPPGPADLPPA
ncbi:hypothetical protein ACFQ0B_48960 [Nonomuraea thailandensis]